MKIRETGLPGLVVIEPRVFADDRGYFFESYNQRQFAEAGIDAVFVQDNQARSTRGVVRGLHYQLPPHAQSKLLRCSQGSIIDTVVDLRRGSPTYGRAYSINLTEDNFLQLFIPKGFAHGYSVLSETCIVQYKCDALYEPRSEAGINPFDARLDIDWGVEPQQAIVSPKDRIWPMFEVAVHDFRF